MKEKLFSLFFCIYLFWNSILSSVLGQTGLAMDGSIMRKTLIGIFTLSLVFFFSFSPKIEGERKVLRRLLLFGILLYSTRFFHRTDPEAFQLYNGQILRWGADCIPGCLIGITLIKLNDYSFIHKILPWLCLLLTPFMAYTTFTLGRMEGQMAVESGLNYQTIAYQMAVLCCYCFYYTFIYKDKKSKLVKLIMLPAMLIQAVCCLMSGGRGGVVLLSVYALSMIYFLRVHNKVPLYKILLAGGLLLLAFFLAADYIGLQESAGFARSSGLLKDEDRYDLWRNYIPYVSSHPMLGWGLGGDYFTVGFYSHNIIVDWLLETGVIGTCVMLSIFSTCFKRLYCLIKLNDIFIIVMIFFIYGLVMNMFSGYWITTSSNWMALAIASTYYAYLNKQCS